MKTGSTLAIALFCLVAVAHLARLFMGWEVLIDGWAAPMWISVLGVLIPGGLALLLWKEAH